MFQVKVLNKSDYRRWHIEVIAEVAAASEKEAIEKVRGFYPRKVKDGSRRTYKVLRHPTVNSLKGVHGDIRSSIDPKHNVNPKG